ncbi:MAG: alpha/beta hydrolase, partial [Paracoccaceae bacterium]|nr:alpha/beta hydrolase [Paracoccaceae bacterium]
NGRRGHTAPRGGVYFEDTTYSDNRVLLAMPAGFDLNKPAALVVFFHGNLATLERDVLGTERVLQQLQNSGINAALIAPQFAVDALDSSAGHFWEPEMFALFMSEAATNLASLWGSRQARDAFAHMPIIMVAYSGGYDPAAFALTVGGVGRRVMGVILLDALFGEPDRFADWIAINHRSAFFFSAYSDAVPDNMEVRHQLEAKGIRYSTSLPRSLRRGQVTFFSTPGILHKDYMTQAWVKDPLTWVLSRVAGLSR